MATPHIQSAKDEIAELVLMPGDPLRAKKIAEEFLTDYKQVNQIRNMFAFTGKYKDKLITIMGSGMGMPSIGIYSYELFNFYDVKKIIRIGSAGAYDPELNLYDLVLASSAYSESSYGKVFGCKEKAIPSLNLNNKLIESAKENNASLKVAPIHSSDVFYHIDPNYYKKVFKKHKTVCVEMESNALFLNAKFLNKEAACILTISDSLAKKEATSALERQEKFMQMAKIALDAIVK